MGFSSSIATLLVKTGLLFVHLILTTVTIGGANMIENCFNYMKELVEYLHVGNWGSAFFGTKKHYFIIPDKFKIIYGDNYLLLKNVYY